MAGRTKGVRPTCPDPLKGRGEARYFTPKGTQGKGGVRRKSKAEGLSAGIVWGVAGARDRKSEERKTKGTRAGYGDGDGEQCGRR